nr:uncharacterized protein LOC128687542 [Cherax quadricarinatus]XP_053630982.1 uncharacterized protein LOC128687542 [Cherax quadricarinatus]XP_053630983.1 uncharacterized protein LOC128687542 [Cherax quadricarinatus]XP_053630984.1 uncharacterized protein LOC128687542 [Cherax quadricarinatus]XP_053630985.1 uncharacterized protein LOC128687542 [Cherax quadricarinatus]
MAHLSRKILVGVMVLVMTLRRRWAAMGVTTLLWGVGVLCIFSFYLAYMQPPGVHVLCECGGEVETGERVARYLPDLMSESDPSTNRYTTSLKRYLSCCYVKCYGGNFLSSFHIPYTCILQEKRQIKVIY